MPIRVQVIPNPNHTALIPFNDCTITEGSLWIYFFEKKKFKDLIITVVVAFLTMTIFSRRIPNFPSS